MKVHVQMELILEGPERNVHGNSGTAGRVGRDPLTVTIACLVAPKLPGLLVSTEIKSSKRIRVDLVCVTLTAGPAE